MTTASPRRPISSQPKPPVRRLPLFRMPALRLPDLKVPALRMPALRIPGPKLPKVSLPELPSLRRQGAHEEGPTGAAAPEVHPRIAGRRDEVAESGRRRRRRVRWISLGVAGALTAVAALLFSPLLDLDQVVVAGVEGSPAAEVRSAMELDSGTAVFGIRPGEVRDRVEALAWVAHARVDVVWPDRVEVVVTPHRPVAAVAVADGNPVSMVTSSGRLLEFEDAGPLLPFTSGLPVVHVRSDASEPEGSAEVSRMLGVLAGLRPATASAVASAELVDGQLVLTAGPGALEGAEFVVGGPDQVPEKIQALEATLAGAVQLDCLSGIDVSVPSRVTIERRSGCVIAEP